MQGYKIGFEFTRFRFRTRKTTWLKFISLSSIAKMTAYENWQNGGKDVVEIKAKLKENMRGDETFKNLYNSGIQVINQMISEINNDHSIPRNLITGHSNRLISLRNTLKDKYEEHKDKEIKVDEPSIDVLSKLIDDNENETLRNLLLIGNEEHIDYVKNRTNIPMSIDHDYIRLERGADGHKINELFAMFHDRTIKEYYAYEGTENIINGMNSEREENNFDKKYYLDFNQCSETTKNEFRKAIHYVEELEIIGNAKKPEIKTHDNEEEIKTLYRGTIYIKNNHLYRQGDGYNIQEVAIDDYHQFPIGEGLIIKEENSKNAQIENEAINAKRELDNETTGKLSLELSEEEKEEYGIKSRNEVFPENVTADHPYENFAARFDTKGKRNIIHYDTSLIDKHPLRKYTEFFGENRAKNKLRNMLHSIGPETYNKFLIETENRVREIIRHAQLWGYHLQRPPVSKRYIESGLMEINLRDKNHKKVDICMRQSGGKGWGGSCDLGVGLYNLIDRHYESEYAEYLNNSIQSKRDETSYLVPTERIITNYDTPPKDNLKSEDRNNIIQGLNMILPIVKDIANEEGHTYFTNNDERRDKTITTTEKLINNLINGNYFSQKEIEGKLNEIIKLFINRDNLQNIVKDTFRDRQRKCLHTIFWSKNQKEKEEAFRQLSKYKSFAGSNTQSQQISDNRAEDGQRTLQTKNEYLNSYLNKIDNLFDVNKGTDSDILYKRSCINKLYTVCTGKNYSKNPGKNILQCLLELDIIPLEHKDNEDLLKKCNDIGIALQKNLSYIDTKLPTVNDIKNKRKIELSELSTRKKKLNNLSNEEEERRNSLYIYLHIDPDLGEDAIEETINIQKDSLKFDGINDLIYYNLAGIYGEIGGGTNNKTFDDIEGIGNFNLSDTNAKIVNEIMTDLIISMATIYIGGGALLNVAKFIAKYAIAGNLGIRMQRIVTRIVKLANKIKEGKNKSKFLKYSLEFEKSIVENTATEATTNMYRGNNPFEAIAKGFNESIKGAIKSIAGLALFDGIAANRWIKKASSKINVRINTKKIPVKIKETLKENGITTATEIITQPVMNLTLGKIDPKTGEYMKREFTRDEHMLGNITAAVIAKSFKNDHLKDPITKGNDVCFYYENNSIYLQFTNKPYNSIKLEDYDKRNDKIPITQLT